MKLKNMIAVFERIRKYNNWDGVNQKIGFERSSYLDRISKYIDNKLIKVLIGQRRVGKSYILRQIIHYLITQKGVSPENIFYLNKEYIAFDEIKSANDLDLLFNVYQEKIKPRGKVYLFLDEIQNVANWENFVNSYSQDFTSDYEIFVTGSNSTLLSGELASLLSGRYVQFEIFPFSFSEYTGFKQLAVNKTNFLQYIQTGGLPEMYNFTNEEVERHYIESLRNTIILRDIVGRNTIKDLALLEEIFKFFSANIGNLTAISSIIKYFKNKQKKVNYETLTTYIGYLLDTFIIHQAERYNLQGKQVLGGERKYYLNDLAFKNYILGYFPTDVGYNLENYVFIQLKKQGYKVSVGIYNTKEIDFVAQKADKTIYVQVAYRLTETKTIEREFGNLLSIKDNYEKIVVSLDDTKFSDYEGIKHLFPWEIEGV